MDDRITEADLAVPTSRPQQAAFGRALKCYSNPIVIKRRVF
jgi:hypothetical protein